MLDDKDLLQRHIEKKKTNYEYFRFMVTVSTTSLLVTIGLLEKIFTNPEWKFLSTISIVSLLIAVIGSVLAYTMDLSYFPNKSGEYQKVGVGIRTIAIGWMGFLIGITSLAIFAIKNLA